MNGRSLASGPCLRTEGQAEKLPSPRSVGALAQSGGRSCNFLSFYLAFRNLSTATHAYSCSVVYSSSVCVWCTVCTVLYRNTVQHNFLEFFIWLSHLYISYSLYCLYFYTVQTFIGVQINQNIAYALHSISAILTICPNNLLPHAYKNSET